MLLLTEIYSVIAFGISVCFTDHMALYFLLTKLIYPNWNGITILSRNARLLFPLAYQQIKANNGETAVNPSQIIA